MITRSPGWISGVAFSRSSLVIGAQFSVLGTERTTAGPKYLYSGTWSVYSAPSMTCAGAGRIADRGADGRDAEAVLLVVVGDPGGTHDVQLLEEGLAIDVGVRREGLQLLGQKPFRLGVRKLREQSLAAGGAVQGEPITDLGDDAQRARRHELVGEQRLVAVEDDELHGLMELVGQALEVRRRLVPQVAAPCGTRRRRTSSAC